MSRALSINGILALIPQQAPFRFIDGIEQVDDEGITGFYTFKQDESFYVGHFPGNPVTPGVILLETMAQTAVVAYGLYLLSKTAEPDVLSQYVTLFSDAKVEFLKPVYPGEKVIITAKKIFFRRMKLKCDAVMTNLQGDIICQCELSGVGVKQS